MVHEPACLCVCVCELDDLASDALNTFPLPASSVACLGDIRTRVPSVNPRSCIPVSTNPLNVLLCDRPSSPEKKKRSFLFPPSCKRLVNSVSPPPLLA